jgi:hypothetical protein
VIALLPGGHQIAPHVFLDNQGQKIARHQLNKALISQLFFNKALISSQDYKGYNSIVGIPTHDKT